MISESKSDGKDVTYSDVSTGIRLSDWDGLYIIYFTYVVVNIQDVYVILV